jgi:hypothetical protein
MIVQPTALRNLLGIFKLVDPAGYEELAGSLKRTSLRMGGVLGKEKEAGVVSGALTPLEACMCAAAALKRLNAIAQPALARVGQRLRTASKVGLVGEVVALLAAAGVIAAIWGAPPKDSIGHVTSICMSVLGFCGAAASLLSRFLRRDIAGAEGGLAAAHRKLVDSVWEADTLGAKLDLVVVKGEAVAQTKEALALVERAEKLAADLFRTVTETGVVIGSVA